MKVLSKFGLKSFSLPAIIWKKLKRKKRRKGKKNREVNSFYHSETPTMRIFSVVDYRNVLARNSRIITKKCFGASELGTYVNATRHRSEGNTKRLICRSFYYSPGLTFTRGSTSQTTDRVSTALTVFSPFFLSHSLFSLRSSHIPFILSLSFFTASKGFFRDVENREMLDSGQSQRAFLRFQIFSHSMWFQLFLASVTRFARRYKKSSCSI